MQQTADDLREALALIEDERHWTQGSYEFYGDDGEVAAYCSVGALRRVIMDATREVDGAGYTTYMKRSMEAQRALARQVTETHPGFTAWDSVVIQFNDDHSHDEVVSIFKQAIIAEEA